MKIKFACPCHFGLESVLSFEIKKIGGENLVTTDGKITFEGDEKMLARANLCLASAERVLIELASFSATSFEELFQGVLSIPLENYIGKNDAFPIKGHSLNSQLHSVPDCQKIIKRAAVKRLEQKYGISWFEETGALHQMQFSIIKDNVIIYLDTTGAGLHKRGYRRNSNDAPIKETLAAGIIDLARIRSNSKVVDPMCGSGTFLIESAYKALNIAPGLRRKFSAESWDQFNSDIWKEERNLALSKIDKIGEFKAYGFDIDGESVALSEENARKAGVGSKVSLDMRDIKDFKRIEGAIALCNPPYGERLLEVREAEKLYRVLGEKLRPDRENPAYIISPHEDFEGFFGKKADKKRKLYNGMIKCNLYMYFK
ncbi:MAG: class I SAM-dependent RNA methyltransferase [Clostridiales bacterium]|nr:class I SAM-dependent RNA methyltransferase [Clostridiales bacterium]